jgi:putative transposase
MTKLPLGNENMSKDPTNRVKKGSKRSLITEAAGVSVELSVSGANTHDVQRLRSTLDDCFRRVPIKQGRGLA